MSKKHKRKNQKANIVDLQPRSLAHAVRGVKTANDFALFMSALMTDLIEGKVAPGIGNAACNAGGKLLKAVEMQIKYGTENDGAHKILRLTVEQHGAEVPVASATAATAAA